MDIIVKFGELNLDQNSDLGFYVIVASSSFFFFFSPKHATLISENILLEIFLFSY